MDIFIQRWIAFDDVRGIMLAASSEELPREMDPLALAATNAVGQLLKETLTDVRRTMGMVIGTTLGCLEQDRRFDESRCQDNGRYASPAAFTRTLPNTMASELSIRFGIGGPTLVVCSGGASTLLALARASVWMHHMGLENCLAGGLDWLGPGVPDEMGSTGHDRCRGVLCLLSRNHSPRALKIVHSSIVSSALRQSTHLDASMLQFTEVLQSGASGEIIADSGDGMLVKLGCEKESSACSDI